MLLPGVRDSSSNIVEDPGDRQFFLRPFALSMSAKIEAQGADICKSQTVGDTSEEPSLVTGHTAAVNHDGNATRLTGGVHH